MVNNGGSIPLFPMSPSVDIGLRKQAIHNRGYRVVPDRVGQSGKLAVALKNLNGFKAGEHVFKMYSLAIFGPLTQMVRVVGS